MKINIVDLQTILAWIRGENLFYNKKSNWDWLLINISNTKSDIYELSTEDFEKIMLEIYEIIKKIDQKKLMETLNSPVLKNLKIDKNILNSEIEKMKSIKNTVENMIISNNINDIQLKKIKLKLLKNKLEQNIQLEKYEECISLSKEIKKIENYFSNV